MHLFPTKNLSERNENLKFRESLKFWFYRLLKIEPPQPKQIFIRENLTFEDNAAVNHIWYQGDADELSQLYRQLGGTGFWAMSSKSEKIQRIHTGLPGEMIDILTQIVISDMLGIEIADNPDEKYILDRILEKNHFSEILEDAVSQTLVIGDGAFRIRMHSEKSEIPVIDFVSGENIQIQQDEIIFMTKYQKSGKLYILQEHYGFGYIKYILTDSDGTEQMLSSLKETENLLDLHFDNSVRLAVQLRFRKSKRYAGRGKSMFDRKRGNFDALDEAWSQYMQAVRKSQVKTYVPSSFADYHPETGEPLRPDPFADNFIMISPSMSENANNQIVSVQPQIHFDGYLSAYITALDLCLQGIISPSTLGIDVKKLDNADAQREKEKTTLYTRNRIISALQKILPELFLSLLWLYHAVQESDMPENLKLSVLWGEYANPSFESQIETLGKAKTTRIISNEALVEELYGDTKKENWKQAEIKRLNFIDGLDSDEEELF